MKLPETGDTIDHYRIVRLADGGGMCLIYEAIATDESSRVAIKVLHDMFGKNAHGRRNLFGRPT